jgi:hypothetical protein
MSRTLTKIGCMAALRTRLAALVAGLVCFFYFPWDTPLVAGHLGCLVVGVRIWVLGLALLTIAAVGFPDVSISNHNTCKY